MMAIKDADSPLNKADHTRINRALRRVQERLGQMADYESCGVECQTIRESLTYLAEQLTRIKERFPPAPTGGRER